MRKILINTISIIGASAIILLSVCLPINAISETCLEDHFERLALIEIDNDDDGSIDETITVTPPSENSCAYVAMSLLLMFYDSYWNEAFVPDELEWESGEYDSVNDELIRTFAAIDEAHSAVRILPICACMGEAAGTAIALCKSTGTNTHTLDTDLLRQTLKDNGADVE